LLLRLDDLLVRKIVAVAKKADLPAVIPGGQWKASDPDYIGPLPWADGWAVGDKNIATWCAHGTMFPLSKWPGFNNIQFWPDPDHSLIATEGGRRKFSTQLSSFADHGGGEPTRVDVMYSAESKPALLQIADALAYVTQRCAHGGSSPNDRRFKALIDQMRPERVLVGTTPQGDLGINVPNQVLNFRPN